MYEWTPNQLGLAACRAMFADGQRESSSLFVAHHYFVQRSRFAPTMMTARTSTVPTTWRWCY